MRTPAHLSFRLALMGLALAWAAPVQAEWQDVATISNTLGNNTGRLCMAGLGTDIGCPTSAPYLDTATGRLGIGTTTPSATLAINGTSHFGGQLVISGTAYTGNLLDIKGTNQFDGAVITSPGPIFDLKTTGTWGYRAIRFGAPADTPFIIGTTNTSNDYLYIKAGGSLPGSNGSILTLTSQTVGIKVTATTALHVNGTLRMADGGETCDTNRLGALKYQSNAFYICQNTTNGWEPLATTGENSAIDRITSSSQAGVTANSTGYISLTTGGITGTAYFTPASVLVNAGVSTTGPVSGTGGYFAGNVGINANPNSSYGLLVANSSGGIIHLQRTGSNANRWSVNITSNAADGIDIGSLMLDAQTLSAGVGVRDINNGVTWYAKASTGNVYVPSGKFAIGLSPTIIPSTSLHVSGTLRIANGGETCDTNRLGALKYQSNAFYICQNTTNGWEPLATTGENSAIDRITSSSQAGVTANSTGYISLTTGGITGTAYFTPASVLVNAGVSTTGPVSTTDGYVANALAVGMPIRNAARKINVTNGLAVYSSSTSPGIYINAINADNSTAGLRLMFNRTTSLSTIQYDTGDGGNTEASNLVLDANGSVGVNMMSGVSGFSSAKSNNPSTTLHVSGTLRMADGGESCDADRTGALKYSGGDFYLCRNGASWESLSSVANSSEPDRIVSGTTTLQVLNNTGYISLTQAGTNTGWFSPQTGLVTLGVSATGPVSATNGYFSGNVGIGRAPTTAALEISATGGANNAQISIGGGAGGAAGKMVFRRGSDGSAQGLIGYASPSETSQLSIASNGGGGYLSLIAATYERMRVTKDGIGISTTAPTTALHVNGTLRMADGGENCDTNRLGALKYTSNQFYICRNGTSWETLVAGSSGSVDTDRITSGTTAVTAHDSGYISLTTGGTTTGYFDTAGNLIAPGVSVTGAISATRGYVGGGWNINSAGDYRFAVDGELGILAGASIQFNAGGVRTWLNPNGFWTNEGSLRTYYFGGDNGAELGVNTHQPSTTLHVSGTIRMADGGENCDADRTGAIKYTGGDFYVCRNGTTWESLASIATGGATVSDGTSGSIVFRDETGTLHAYNTFLISSTTGSLGIGGNASSALESNSLYVANDIQAGDSIFSNMYAGSTGSGNSLRINTGSSYISLYAGGIETARITSSSMGIGTANPQTALHVSGTLKLADGLEACDTSRLGAIKYASNQFYLCRNGSSWETLVASSNGSLDTDRITSGTTAVTTNSATSTISFTTGGTTTAYLHSTLGLVAPGVSTTGTISGTSGYFNGELRATGDVYGYRYFGSELWLDNDGYIHWSNDTYIVGNGINHEIRFGANNADAMIITSTSYVGIGTMTPTAELEVSGTISATALVINGQPITGGSDNLGDHTATTNLNMSTFNISGIGTLTASGSIVTSGTIQTTGAVQAGNTDTTCSAITDYGKMRFDEATGRMYLCRP